MLSVKFYHGFWSFLYFFNGNNEFFIIHWSHVSTCFSALKRRRLVVNACWAQTMLPEPTGEYSSITYVLSSLIAEKQVDTRDQWMMKNCIHTSRWENFQYSWVGFCSPKKKEKLITLKTSLFSFRLQQWLDTLKCNSREF